MEERPQKHQGKKIQAKPLVPIKNKNHNRNNKAEKSKNLMIRLLSSLISFNGRVSVILSLVGHIQLTKTPPQEQLETISSSTLVWGTFFLSFKGGVYKSKRSQ